MNTTRTTHAIALCAAAALAVGLAGCGDNSDSGDPGGSGDGGQVTITWWHNVTSDPGKTVFQNAADRFMDANPNVKIEIVPIQNEDLQDKLQTALNGSDAPDMFQQWGGGEMAEQVDQGLVMDISADSQKEVEFIGGSMAPWQYDGKTYGLPYTAGVAGVYYSKDLFDQAGITETPQTWEQFNDVVAKLKAAGIVPVGLGGKDAWPAGHWMYIMTLRMCGQEVIAQDTENKAFDDPCYLQAAQLLEDFGKTEPFEEGWVSVSAQQGAGSSSGMLANHKLAMEFSGVWETGQVQSLTPDGQPLADLHWFPFPSVAGGKGDPKAAVGGGDGFSCHAKAPKECADFLRYLVGDETQAEYAETGAGIPVNPSAVDKLTTESLKEAAAGSNEASFLQLWLDKAFGDSVGETINQESVGVLSGKTTPEQYVQGLIDAAKKG
ncbi:MAG: extracellular solute-binding protein [Bifidobacteriaceae bacterium]|jgi:ABC-type glycerol-3-phosphate transport system substrate-binding protein|nr:extracellular solute-binding protein [Bifidobacteriaceae bacterium]